MDKAWLMDGELLASTGTATSYHLKCWVYLRNKQLRWELRRLFDAVCYKDRSEGTSVAHRVDAHIDDWQAACGIVGLTLLEHFNYSLHSLQKQDHVNRNNEGDTEQDYWVSSAGAIALLMFWSDFRRYPRGRAISLRMLDQFFMKLLK